MRFLILFLLLALPALADAASFSLEVTEGAGGYEAVLLIETDGEAVNVIEGTLVVPGGIQTASVYTGTSVVSNWLEAPKEDGGAVRFAGMVPGGFTGSAVPGEGLTGPVPLFSFRAPSVEGARIQSAAVYVNDGQGTRRAVADGALPIRMVAGEERPPDRTPPEYLHAERGEDASQGGVPVLFIDAYDAESGIDRYEVSEEKGVWREAGSLYVIEGKGGKSIVVRAYDRAGNFIETRVPGEGETLYVWMLIALLAVIALLAGVYLKQRRRS